MAWRPALLLALLLAGCLGSQPPPAASTTTVPTAPTQEVASEGPLAEDEPRKVPISFDGHLPTGALVCASGAGCHGAATAESKSDVKVANLSGIVSSIHLTMTWSAAAPTMRTLSLAAMVMYPDDCAGCESVELAAAKGSSPLRLDADDLAVPIDPRGVLHVYFYAEGAQAPEGYAGTSVDTAVRVEGAARIQAR